MVLNFVYLNLSLKLLLVQTCILHLHLSDWSLDIKIVRGARRNRCFHGPLRFIACASCACFASGSISLEKRSSPCRKDGKSGRYLFAFSRTTKHRNPMRYARRDTKVSQISDWRIASKIARRVNNRYVFASRGMSRGMSAYWMHPRVSHDDRRHKEKEKHFRRASDEIERDREKRIVPQQQFHSVKCKFFPLHYDRAIWSAISKLIDGDAVIDTDLLVAYKDISVIYLVFRLQSNRNCESTITNG